MIRRTILIALFCVLPLSAQEDHRKPSPFPEKERNHVSSIREDKAKPQGTTPVPDERAKPVVRDSWEAPPPGGTGEACFFSKRSDGGRTASGEPLNSQEMVAAHASLPLRSRVKVTNVSNGKTVEVRIIDRMPLSRRMISVSEVAAKELGFLSAGTAQVKLEPLSN